LLNVPAQSEHLVDIPCVFASPLQALGSHGSCSTEVEKETQEKMTILQTYFRQNRDEVLDNLLAFVCDIRPEIHENYRING
jgi:V-type H+-transporting ATPase subunit G